MGFGTEVEDLRVMYMVDMSKDTEQLSVDVFDCGGECLGKIVTFKERNFLDGGKYIVGD